MPATPLTLRVSLLLTGLSVFAGSGCAYFPNASTPAELDRGLTVVLPGVEGASWWNSNVAQGLRDGGVQTAIEVEDWTTGNALLFPLHLRHNSRNRKQAERLAAKIVAYQDEHPQRPVNLVGISGGGGMALLTLEALPPGRKVTNVVLLSPAISPRYDVQAALDRTERTITNVYSPYDVFVLGAGTALFGTIDGHHTASAGMVGFDLPEDLPPEDLSRLRQLKYEWRMAGTGNLGGHMGSSTRPFIRDYVATRLTEPRAVTALGP